MIPAPYRLPTHSLSKLSVLQGKTVAVTGGCGFLGRHIVEILVQAGASVRVFDVVTPDQKSRVENVSYVTGDLLNKKDLLDLFAGPVYAVIHVASPSPMSQNAELFMRVNVGGTRNVIEAMRE